MRFMIAALVAVVVLWALDTELNNGTYTFALRQVVSGMSGHRI
jgi:hypothetical protein